MTTLTMPALTPDNAILALSAFSALIHIPYILSPPSYTRMATKTASTTLLSLLAYQRSGPPLLVGALALGSLGDAFLAWHGDANFLRGLASFLTSHVLYFILLAQSGGGTEVIMGETWRLGAATVFLVVMTPTMGAILMPRVARKMRAPILVYSGVIACMVAAALTTERMLVIAGAILFTTSDVILSIEKFVVEGGSAKMKYTVWVLYYVGQLLIALGFVPGG